MSDGISEARRGTYFRDRSQLATSEKEILEGDLRRLDIELQELQYEREVLKEKIKKITEG